MSDPLAGFRGGTSPPPTATEPDPAEELRKRLGPEESELVAVVQFSAEMEDFVQQHPVGKRLYEHCTRKVSACSEVIFTTHDLSTDKVKKAHFEGRVACEVLKFFDAAILAGQDAEQAITAADGSTDGDKNGDKDKPAD